jgi:hypothetical protein
VEGPACEYKETQGLFKEKGSAEPWILDPTTNAAEDHVVHPTHGSTMDRAKGYPPDLIMTVRKRSHGLGCVRARNSGACAGNRGGVAALHRRITSMP